MQTNELNDLVNYLGVIRNATESGKMVWSQQNETTFIWKVANVTHTRIVIQKISQGIGAGNLYYLQAFDQANKCQLEVRSDANNLLAQHLRALYSSIESIRDKKSLEFLKSILP